MAPRLLLVEDSPIVQEIVAGWLTEAGYEVTLAPNGQEGLDHALQIRPDLVVSDISMPVADGYWLCRQLRASSQTARTPVILLTSRDQAVDILHGLDAGADAFVVKSDSGDELLQRVSRLLATTRVDDGQLRQLSEQLVLTRDRGDILKLLFSTLQREARFDVVAFLVFAGPDELFSAFVTVSPVPLAEETSRHLLQEVSSTGALLGHPVDVGQVISAAIVVHELHPRLSLPPGPRTALRIPLQVSGEVIGVLGVFCFATDCDIQEKIRFFFDVGAEGARALQRIALQEREA